MKLTFTLISDLVRQNVLARVRTAPAGWRVTIDEGKRTDEQNARFHAALTHFAEHAEHFGKKLTVKTWKAVFLAELAKEHGAEIEVVPSLDGSEILTVGRSTAELSGRDFSDLIELVYSEGSKRGIVFYEPRLDPDWKPRRARKAKRAAAAIGVSSEKLAAEAGRAA
jgi:hypothetical protein